MARPQRNNVDYFPFICKEGKTMYFIEQKYGNDGYATWIKILRELAVTNHHYLHLNDRVQMMFIASKCKVAEEILINIINDLCDLGEFHEQLWKENRVIFSQKFIANIRDAYKKRNNECITLRGLEVILCDLGIRKLYKPLPEGSDNPHSKEENSKEENSKEEASSFVPEKKVDLFFKHGSEEFLKAWNKWLEYLKERKKPYHTFSSQQAALDLLAKYEERIAISMINQAIACQWLSIFPLKDQPMATESGYRNKGPKKQGE
jgi:hypothetical protein